MRLTAFLTMLLIMCSIVFSSSGKSYGDGKNPPPAASKLEIVVGPVVTGPRTMYCTYRLTTDTSLQHPATIDLRITNGTTTVVNTAAKFGETVDGVSFYRGTISLSSNQYTNLGGNQSICNIWAKATIPTNSDVSSDNSQITLLPDTHWHYQLNNKIWLGTEAGGTVQTLEDSNKYIISSCGYDTSCTGVRIQFAYKLHADEDYNYVELSNFSNGNATVVYGPVLSGDYDIFFRIYYDALLGSYIEDTDVVTITVPD